MMARVEKGLPGAGPHQVGVGALQGHGTRLQPRTRITRTGQLPYALQGSHLLPPPLAAAEQARPPRRGTSNKAGGGAGGHLTPREDGAWTRSCAGAGIAGYHVA